jgi:hypothetical protein
LQQPCLEDKSRQLRQNPRKEFKGRSPGDLGASYFNQYGGQDYLQTHDVALPRGG